MRAKQTHLTLQSRFKIYESREGHHAVYALNLEYLNFIHIQSNYPNYCNYFHSLDIILLPNQPFNQSFLIYL